MSKKYISKVIVFLGNMQDPVTRLNFWHEYSSRFNVSCSGCAYYVDPCHCLSIYRLRRVIK